MNALVRLAIDGLISFSSYPLHLATYFGFASAGLALLLTIGVLIDSVYIGATPRGWASTIVVVLFMGAVQLIGLGIIGEYLRRVFLESKQRPTYIVESIATAETRQKKTPATSEDCSTTEATKRSMWGDTT